MKPQHLEDKVFLMGQGKMLGAVNQDNLVFEEPVPPEENKEKRRKGNC